MYLEYSDLPGDRVTAASIARQTRQLIKKTAAGLTGRERGPDHDPTGQRRIPRRDSYDVDDPKAKPWSRIGDGSVGQGLAFRDALIQVAGELQHQHWKDRPQREVREAQARYEALSAELDAYTAGAAAPIGRPAVVRQERAAAKAIVDAARTKLRAIDVRVLAAILRSLDFATGRLFPAIETIADRAACHRNSVIGALRRLKHHGLIAWVRRTLKTGNDREFAPQREQTSNAYFFDHRAAMKGSTWQRYWQLVVMKLRRTPPRRPDAPPPIGPAVIADPALRSVLDAMAAHFASPGHAST